MRAFDSKVKTESSHLTMAFVNFALPNEETGVKLTV